MGDGADDGDRATADDAPAQTPTTDPLQHQPGARVELRRRLDGQWAKGFEVIEPTETGSYRVRRLSDGEELPVTIDAVDLRAQRKRSGWWY